MFLFALSVLLLVAQLAKLDTFSIMQSAILLVRVEASRTQVQHVLIATPPARRAAEQVSLFIS